MLPQDFLERMKELLGEEYQAFAESYNQTKRLSLRVNPLKKKEEAFENHLDSFAEERVSWEESGYYYGTKVSPGKHPYHEAGVYYIQEASAMAPVHFLDAKPGEKILDLCAAPGGKSTQIAGLQ